MAGPNSCGRCEYPFLKDINPVELLYSHPVINLQPAFFGTTHFRTSQISPWFVVCGAWVFRKSGTVACHQPSTRTLGTAPHSRTICPPYHGNNCKHVSLAEGGDFVFFFTFLCPPIFFFFFYSADAFFGNPFGHFHPPPPRRFSFRDFRSFFMCVPVLLFLFVYFLYNFVSLLAFAPSFLASRPFLFFVLVSFSARLANIAKKKEKKRKKEKGVGRVERLFKVQLGGGDVFRKP